MYDTYEQELELLIDKVEGGNDYTWEEMVAELDANMAADHLRKSFNGGRYSGYNVCKYFMQKEDDARTDEDIQRLNTIKNEVYKEKVKLSDQRREYRKALSKEARYENLVNVLREEISELDEIPTFVSRQFSNTGVSAALLLSDLHYGASSDNCVNFYNTDVCKERLEQLFDKTVYYCALHRVQTLYINILGDIISGIIHCNARIEQEEDVISQIIHASELLSNFIGNLTAYVPEVKIVGVIGNHSRVSPNKHENLNVENFERLIFEYIKIRLPNVSMILNGLEDWCLYNIGDRTIYIEHGDKCTPATIRNNCINLTGRVPDECFMGHLHHYEIINANGTSVILNGSIMGTDSYAMGKRLNSSPSQVLRVYDRDTCTYNIELE